MPSRHTNPDHKYQVYLELNYGELLQHCMHSACLACDLVEHLSLVRLRTLAGSLTCNLIYDEGVIWRGDSLIEGVPETLDFLRSLVRLDTAVVHTL